MDLIEVQELTSSQYKPDLGTLGGDLTSHLIESGRVVH